MIIEEFVVIIEFELPGKLRTECSRLGYEHVRKVWIPKNKQKRKFIHLFVNRFNAEVF